MFRPIKYSEAARRLAGLARKMAMDQHVLYHGTRYAQSILSTGVLFPAEAGGKVCLTRSPEVAAYWAMLQRGDDEGRGSILIFDRQSLHCRYKIEPYHDPIWDEKASSRDEAEEGIWNNIIDVGKHLVGFVSEPMTQSSDRLKTLNCKFRMQVEARLNELLYFVPDWRYRPEEPLGLFSQRARGNALTRSRRVTANAQQPT